MSGMVLQIFTYRQPTLGDTYVNIYIRPSVAWALACALSAKPYN